MPEPPPDAPKPRKSQSALNLGPMASRAKSIADQQKATLMSTAVSKDLMDEQLRKIAKASPGMLDAMSRIASSLKPSQAMQDALADLDRADRSLQGLSDRDFSVPAVPLVAGLSPAAAQVQATRAVEAAVYELVKTTAQEIGALSSVSRAQLVGIDEMKGGIAALVGVVASGQERTDKTNNVMVRLTFVLVGFTLVVAVLTAFLVAQATFFPRDARPAPAPTPQVTASP